jgi:YVTN family beta-propeller protein
MFRTLVGATLAALLSACHLPARGTGAVPRLGDEGEIWIYLQPIPDEAGRLTVALQSAVAVRSDGVELPLSLRLPRISRGDASRQRLLAWGRLPPGAYEGFRLGASSATLAGEDGASQLLVPKEPALVPAPFRIGRGKATVLGLDLRYAGAVEKAYGFTPAFSPFVPERPVPQLVGYCSDSGSAALTVFDRQRRRVGDVVSTGAGPRGMVIDASFARVYVAASAEDAVEVFDVAAATPLTPIRLQIGDRPAELAFAPDGRTLLVTNEGSSSVAFLDVRTLSELSRVAVGDSPRALLLDRAGQRAFVLSQRSNAITVLDVPNRAVIATVPTDTEPLRAALSRDGSRLYVVFGGSTHMSVFSLPDLALVSRVFVGLGARAVLVDTRTDLVYVAGELGDRISVVDPLALVPVDALEVPGEVTWLAIAEAEDTLFALAPDRRQVAVVELTSRQTLGALDVGDAPYQVVVAGQRR